VESRSSFWRERQFISFNSSVFIENLPSSERAPARAHANHAKNDAQKGCTMQFEWNHLNPLIYAIGMQEFRKAVKHLTCKRVHEPPRVLPIELHAT